MLDFGPEFGSRTRLRKRTPIELKEMMPFVKPPVILLLRSTTTVCDRAFLRFGQQAWARLLFLGLLGSLSLRASHAQNWNWQNPLPHGLNLNEVFFTTPDTGYAVGLDGSILQTTSGGTDWSPQHSGTTNGLAAVFFTDPDTGYVTGSSSTLLKTTNGGEDWSPLPLPVPYFTAIHFTSASVGYGVGTNGNAGVIMKTVDGGLNWVVQHTGTVTIYNAVYFVNDSTGFVVGGNGRIFGTTNGGATWTQQTSGVTTNLLSVYFTDANNGYISEYGRILRTTNGGQTWTYLTIFQSYELWSIRFTDANTGYAVGRTGKIL